MTSTEIGERSASERVFAQLSGYCLAGLAFTYAFWLPLGGGAKIPNVYFIVLILFITVRMRRLDLWLLLSLTGLLFGILAVQYAVGLPPGAELSRSILGTILLIVSCFTCIEMLDCSAAADHRWLFQAMRVLLWLHIAVQIAHILYYLAGGIPSQTSFLPWLPRDAGFALEASHVPIILAPLIFIAVLAPARFKQLMGRGAFTGLWLSLFVFGISATAFIVLAMAGAIRLLYLRNMRGIILSAVSIALVLALAILFLPQIRDRVIGALLLVESGDPTASTNLSVLVFAKGAELASIALRHYPLGVGALDLRALAPYSELNRLFPIVAELNNDDGSSLLFKGIGEYGVLYFGFLAVVIVQLKRRMPSIEYDTGALFEAGCLFAVLAGSVRMASYFESPAIIGIAIAFRHIVSRGWRVTSTSPRAYRAQSG